MQNNSRDFLVRTELLVGSDAMQRIDATRVIIFGVGGVGSWCAESLVRSGIRHLTIVDADRIAVSNINRQLMATTDTVGQPKTEALRQRLLSINPQADISARQQIYDETTADSFDIGSYDYVIDAIDSLKDKALLIINACRMEKTTLFSSMGAALKMDPQRIRTGYFHKVEGDPLARALRKKFKHRQQFPERKFMCVYSDERLDNHDVQQQEEEGPQLFNKPVVNGTIAHITAIFGFTLASMVIRHITVQQVEQN